MRRRDFLTKMLAGTAVSRMQAALAWAQEPPGGVTIERAAAATPRKGKVLLPAVHRTQRRISSDRIRRARNRAEVRLARSLQRARTGNLAEGLLPSPI
jgi:hypothetical protein